MDDLFKQYPELEQLLKVRRCGTRRSSNRQSIDHTKKLNILAVNHIAIICSDYNASLAFYRDILGMELISEVYREERSSMMAKLSMNGQYLIELFTFPDSPKRPSYPEACGLRHLAFSVANLDDTFEYMTAKGVECESIRTAPDGERCFFTHDPDGLPIEFVENK